MEPTLLKIASYLELSILAELNDEKQKSKSKSLPGALKGW